MEMTPQEPAVTQGPLGWTSMPRGSRVNGVAARLLNECTDGTYEATLLYSDTQSGGSSSRSVVFSYILTQINLRRKTSSKNPAQVDSTSFCHTSTAAHNTCISAHRADISA